MAMIKYLSREYLEGVLQTEALNFEKVRSRLDADQVLRLLHATLGLSSEIIELAQATQKSPYDRIEILGECGDLFWYAGVAADALNRMIMGDGSIWRRDPWFVFDCIQDEIVTDSRIDSTCYLSDMLCDSEKILTSIKAHLFYGREIEWMDAMHSVSDIVNGTIGVAAQYGFSKGDITRANVEKLRNKKTGRYKGGKFSEEAANDRNTTAEFVAVRGATMRGKEHQGR